VRGYVPDVLLLAILGFGLFAGAVAQLLLGSGLYNINWGELRASVPDCPMMLPWSAFG
jgi:hypothetical protein